jgi:hypothetical protein
VEMLKKRKLLIETKLLKERCHSKQMIVSGLMFNSKSQAPIAADSEQKDDDLFVAPPYCQRPPVVYSFYIIKQFTGFYLAKIIFGF